MKTRPMIYCLRCGTLRAVDNCYQAEDEQVIQLDGCPHVILRTEFLEWFVDGTYAVPEPADVGVPEVASRF
jgi:hypothetical protein